MYKLMTALLVVCVAAPVYAQNPDQQGKDSYECNQIAVSQTGYNPAAPQAAATPRGQALRGGAGGAAIGAAGGAIGGNAAKGAAMGAAVGGGVGAIRGRRQRKQAEQQQASSQQSYKAAFAACMQSRGWNVH